MAEEWNKEPLDTRRGVCLKQRRTAKCAPQPLDTLPAEWRGLLKVWAAGKNKRRWETLRNTVDSKRTQLPYDLLKWLLQTGWAAIVEERRVNDLNNWLPKEVELLHLPQLRAALGVRDKDADTRRWNEIRAELPEKLDDSFTPALLMLDRLPVRYALERYGLLTALQTWRNTQQTGTRRNFAYAAREDTKKITPTEWNWLASIFDLAEFCIEQHTPSLLVSAPLSLHMPQGRFDLAACPDFAALTPATVTNIQAITGTVSHWHVVENLTSFENVAKKRDHADSGVIWLPGFPSGWWYETVGHLLDLAPAPALLSCDPDPAGIAIALKAAELWQEHGLAWQAESMSATDLSALPARKPLSDADRKQLASLQSSHTLPPMLAGLAEWMLQHGEKGEQEGYL